CAATRAGPPARSCTWGRWRGCVDGVSPGRAICSRRDGQASDRARPGEGLVRPWENVPNLNLVRGENLSSANRAKNRGKSWENDFKLVPIFSFPERSFGN